jgi:NTE family protein
LPPGLHPLQTKCDLGATPAGLSASRILYALNRTPDRALFARRRANGLVCFRTMMRGCGCIAVTILLLLTGRLEAQPGRTQNPRPRVGLVLAGGSARGLAHVGVLAWLSEHRIPVDCIAGASMGGLVAGLYASGYEPEEIREFVRVVDWGRTLRPSPPFRELSYRRKEDRRDFPNQLELGLKEGLSLPRGLSPGHGIGLLLCRFTSPYPALRSFDELPTPFRTVAVDLKDGTEFVFQDGSLFDALRSTMAIPGVFSPWEVDGRTFVDGGLLNNLPVDVVKEMGADIIIAVPLKSHVIASEKMPTSLAGIVDRSLDIMIGGTELRRLALAQIVLSPEVAGYASADFYRWRELADLGYQAAARQAAQLEPLALTEDQWSEYLAQRRQRRRTTPARPAFLVVQGAAGGKDSAAVRELSHSVTAPYATDQLETALTRVTGWGRFEAADYQVTERNGLEGYQVNLREKEYGPPFLNTLLLIDGSQSDGIRLGVGARLTFLDVPGPFSEWRSDVNFGILNRVSTELFWRVRATRWFVAPRGFYENSDFDVYREGTKQLSVEFSEPGAGLDVGYEGGRTDEIRFGYRISRLTASQSLGTPTFPEAAGVLSQFRLRWAHEGQDDAMVPRHGVRAVNEWRWVGQSPLAARRYSQFETRLSWATPVKRRNTILAVIEGGFTTNDQVPYPVFSLGGPFRLSALSRDEMFGSRYYYTSVSVLRLLSEHQGILGDFHAGVIYEAGRAFRLHQSANPYQDIAVGIVGETPLGLVFLGPSYGENGQWKVSFRLGRLF